MLKSVIRAAFVAASLCFSSFGLAAAQPSAALSLAEIRQAIQTSGDIALKAEQIVSGDTVMFVEYEGVQVAMVVSCPKDSAGCTGIAFYTPYPNSIRAGLEYINKVNSSTKFAWLSLAESGRLAAHHSLLLSGVSRGALLLNIRIYTAVYVMRGQSIIQNGGGNLISAAPDDRTRIIDAEHLPEPTIGATGDLSGLFNEVDLDKDLTEILSDAQRYGQLRKIANDFFE